MKDHADIVERWRWNAFKREYRKSYPSQNRNTRYYTRLRHLYAQQSQPNLEPWVKMSSPPVPVTEQELIDQAREGQKQLVIDTIQQEMGDCVQNIEQLRDYLVYLRHKSKCPPHIIAAIQHEIFQLTLI